MRQESPSQTKSGLEELKKAFAPLAEPFRSQEWGSGPPLKLSLKPELSRAVIYGFNQTENRLWIGLTQRHTNQATLSFKVDRLDGFRPDEEVIVFSAFALDEFFLNVPDENKAERQRWDQLWDHETGTLKKGVSGPVLQSFLLQNPVLLPKLEQKKAAVIAAHEKQRVAHRPFGSLGLTFREPGPDSKRFPERAVFAFDVGSPHSSEWKPLLYLQVKMRQEGVELNFLAAHATQIDREPVYIAKQARLAETTPVPATTPAAGLEEAPVINRLMDVDAIVRLVTNARQPGSGYTRTWVHLFGEPDNEALQDPGALRTAIQAEADQAGLSRIPVSVMPQDTRGTEVRIFIGPQGSAEFVLRHTWEGGDMGQVMFEVPVVASYLKTLADIRPLERIHLGEIVLDWGDIDPRARSSTLRFAVTKAVRANNSDRVMVTIHGKEFWISIQNDPQLSDLVQTELPAAEAARRILQRGITDWWTSGEQFSKIYGTADPSGDWSQAQWIQRILLQPFGMRVKLAYSEEGQFKLLRMGDDPPPGFKTVKVTVGRASDYLENPPDGFPPVKQLQNRAGNVVLDFAKPPTSLEVQKAVYQAMDRWPVRVTLLENTAYAGDDAYGAARVHQILQTATAATQILDAKVRWLHVDSFGIVDRDGAEFPFNQSSLEGLLKRNAQGGKIVLTVRGDEAWVSSPAAGLEENRSPNGEITAEVEGKEVTFQHRSQAPVRLKFLAPIASVFFSPDSLNAIVRTDPTPSIHLLDLSPLALGSPPKELWLHSVFKEDGVTFGPDSKSVFIVSLRRRIHLDVLKGRLVSAGLEETAGPANAGKFDRYEAFTAAHDKVSAQIKAAAGDSQFGDALWGSWLAIQVLLTQVEDPSPVWVGSKQKELKELLTTDIFALASYYHAHYSQRGQVTVGKTISNVPEPAKVRFHDLFGNNLPWNQVQPLTDQKRVAAVVQSKSEKFGSVVVVLETPDSLLEKARRKGWAFPGLRKRGEILFAMGTVVSPMRPAYKWVQEARIAADQQNAEQAPNVTAAQGLFDGVSSEDKPIPVHAVKAKLIYPYPSGDDDPFLNDLTFLRRRWRNLPDRDSLGWETVVKYLAGLFEWPSTQMERELKKADHITPQSPFASEGDARVLIQEALHFLSHHPKSEDPAAEILRRIDKNEPTRSAFTDALEFAVSRLQEEQNLFKFKEPEIHQLQADLLATFPISGSSAAGLEQSWTSPDGRFVVEAVTNPNPPVGGMILQLSYSGGVLKVPQGHFYGRIVQAAFSQDSQRVFAWSGQPAAKVKGWDLSGLGSAAGIKPLLDNGISKGQSVDISGDGRIVYLGGQPDRGKIRREWLNAANGDHLRYEMIPAAGLEEKESGGKMEEGGVKRGGRVNERGGRGAVLSSRSAEPPRPEAEQRTRPRTEPTSQVPFSVSPNQPTQNGIASVHGDLQQSVPLLRSQLQSGHNPDDEFITSHKWNLSAAGLEEVPLVVDLTGGAAGRALQRDHQVGIAATVIAQTPTDFKYLLQAGLEAASITGLLWGGLEEQDYLTISRRIGGLIGLDPTESGLEEKLQRLFAAQGRRVVVVVRDVASFLAGLEQLGFPAAGLEDAARNYNAAREGLLTSQ